MTENSSKISPDEGRQPPDVRGPDCNIPPAGPHGAAVPPGVGVPPPLPPPDRRGRAGVPAAADAGVVRRLGDVNAVAAALSCSTKTVRRMADAGRLPGVVRLGRLLRFDLEVLSRWIGQGCPPASRFDRTRGGGGGTGA